MAKRKHLQPLGDSFQIHADCIVDMGLLSDGMNVCHGEVYCPDHNYRGHAWIEFGNACIDLSSGRKRIVSRDRYYFARRIKNVKRYTPDELQQMMLETGNCGPWHLK